MKSRSWQIELTETYRVVVESDEPLTRKQAIEQVEEFGGNSPLRRKITARPVPPVNVETQDLGGKDAR